MRFSISPQLSQNGSKISPHARSQASSSSGSACEADQPSSEHGRCQNRRTQTQNGLLTAGSFAGTISTAASLNFVQMDEERGQLAVVVLCHRRANGPESSEEEQQSLRIGHHVVDALGGVWPVAKAGQGLMSLESNSAARCAECDDGKKKSVLF
eukprot:SAG31_NODE_2048_length_6565_cov_2.692700_7_plen_154_part_00